MKTLSIAVAVLVAMVFGVQASDTVTSVNVVGYYNVDIAAGEASDFVYSLLSVPMTKIPVVRGVVSGNTAGTISDSSASWGNDDFAYGGGAAGEVGNSTYYVEITTGTFEGRHFYVSANDATTLTLASTVADLTADNLVGQGYKIVPAQRIRDIFGEPAGPIELKSGTSPATSDTIQLWEGTAWGGEIYHHSAGAWLKAGLAGTAEDLVVDRDEGMLVKRSAGEALASLTMVGEVSANDQAIVLSEGYNLIGGMSAVSPVLDDTALASVLTAGTSPGNSDTLQTWAGSSWEGEVYRHSAGAWLQAGVAGVVGDTYSIQAGRAYLFNVDGAKTWVRSSPLD